MKTLYKVQQLDKTHWGVVEIPRHPRGEPVVHAVYTNPDQAHREKRSLNGAGARPLGQVVGRLVRSVEGHRHG